MRRLAWIAAAALAAPALGSAQILRPKEPQPPPATTPPTGTPPTTAPPPTQAPPTTTPAPGGGTTTQPTPAPAPGATPPATPQGQEAMEAMHTANVQWLQFATLIEQKATSPKLKQHASRLRGEHERLERELQAMAQQRGVKLTPDDALRASPGHAAKIQQFQAMSGAQFDGAAADELAQHQTAMVDHLKALRDATPGKDAELKGWLDRTENTMEEQRNLARQMRKDVQNEQRQGRRPSQ
jgi:predicted outer membrane protein